VIVTDTDPAVAFTDRAAVAVDALDRFCVAYSLQPTATFTKRQVAARVMAFDGTRVTYLTKSFFPFVNFENDTNALRGLETFHPSVAMTTREICIAAKGQINSTNNPVAGPDTAPQTVLYTVISHPDPVAAPRPTMTLNPSQDALEISWDADAGLFTLTSSPSLAADSWTKVTPQPAFARVGNRYQMTVTIGSDNLFFRLVR
jgi:hypothetical protein